VGSLFAGQTFYLEFPPVVKDGQPFINSTPRLFPPLSDYACPNRRYYIDFGGTDDDGDSLVYSLITPLSTKVGVALPPPGPRPYPNVTFQPGFSVNNFMQGDPDLAISDDGFLTVTPRFQGLFVFAVRVEEFRNGVKLGEVRRDFQMLVIESCPVAEPPSITGRMLNDTQVFEGNMNVTFSNTTSDQDRCIEVEVSDPDAAKMSDGFKEKISIRAIPLSYKGAISSFVQLPVEQFC
jgi:hypothetical protein